jgi:hypothetical protein
MQQQQTGAQEMRIDAAASRSQANEAEVSA